MVEFTNELAGNSLIIMLIGYVIALGFQLYMAYLNWKQSKVKNQMENLIIEVREIKYIIQEKNKKK